jgi:UDP-GlcNAc:undecaprenyl-phosphate GlcNAc-1-phosphate transferase
VILWTWTAALSGFVLFPLFAPESNAIIPFAVIVFALLLFTLFHPGLRYERLMRRNGARTRSRARGKSRSGVHPDTNVGPKLGVSSGNGSARARDLNATERGRA